MIIVLHQNILLLSESFCDKGGKCELGFFRGVYCGESSPKFQKYNERKANDALTKENQNANN